MMHKKKFVHPIPQPQSVPPTPFEKRKKKKGTKIINTNNPIKQKQRGEKSKLIAKQNMTWNETNPGVCPALPTPSERRRR